MRSDTKWRHVRAEDVPLLSVIRCHQRGQFLTGVLVDVMRQHGMTAFVVRDEDGSHHVVPTTIAFDIADPAPDVLHP